MPVLNDAVAIKYGTTDVAAVYAGSVKVWPSTPSGGVSFDVEIVAGRWRAGVSSYQGDTTVPPAPFTIDPGMWELSINGGLSVGRWEHTGTSLDGPGTAAYTGHFHADGAVFLIDHTDADGNTVTAVEQIANGDVLTFTLV